MAIAGVKSIKPAEALSLEATPARRPTLLARALEAMRGGQLERAWLCADRLCRTSAGQALADAYLLRSAIFALEGDRTAAGADLRAAIHIDPDAPAPNRALLASPQANERVAAARCLLRAADADDRNVGFAALARANVTCVGLLSLVDGKLAVELAWNGPETVSLTIRTDLGEQRVDAKRIARSRPPGYEHAGRIDASLPPQSSVVTVATRELDSLFEPASLLLSPPNPFSPRCDARAVGREPLIIVPVYDDRTATLACLESLFACRSDGEAYSIVVVDDVSPDSALSADLDEFAARGRIRLLRNAINMGFAGSVNRAWTLRQPGQDVLLLNADTIVPPGAVEGLVRHVRSSADIGTITALSNNGEDTSFPRRFRPNPMPDGLEIAAIQNVATRVNAGRAINMPNGVGFCLYVRGELCDILGPLSHRYGRGYYEDVEFCLKAAEVGYRNVCATDVYVGHHGSRSFADGKRALVVRNLDRIKAAYPFYLAQARAFEAGDPLREAIARIEEELLRGLPNLDLVVLPFDTPEFLVKTIMSGLAQSHLNPVTARVRQTNDILEISLAGADGAIPQNIIWRCATDAQAGLAKRLSGLSIRTVTMLDADELPTAIVEAVAGLAVDTRLLVAHQPTACRMSRLSAAPVVAVTPAIRKAMSLQSGHKDVEVLEFPDLPQLHPPRLAKTGGILAIMGMLGARDDLALLQALGKAMHGSKVRPSIVVAGTLPPDAVASLPDTIHVSGRIGEEELPDWLTRLGPQALFFADRKWGMADPRTTTWGAAGIAIACFGDGIADIRDDGHGLILPRKGEPVALANVIAAWLSSARP